MNAQVSMTRVSMTSRELRGKPEVETFVDHVTVCGVRVERPPSIAPSQWLAFWHAVKAI